VIDTT